MKGQRMERKRALMTGVTSGIGREVALGLVRLGYDLVVIARNEAKVADLRNEAEALVADVRVDFHHADLSQVASTKAAVDAVAAEVEVVIEQRGLIGIAVPLEDLCDVISEGGRCQRVVQGAGASVEYV